MPESDPTTAPVPTDLDDLATLTAPPGISRRQALAMGGGLAAAAAVIGAGPASAQTASPPASPSASPDPTEGPTTPPPATDTPGITGQPQEVRSISLTQAQTVLAGALAAVGTLETPPMFVVIIDVCGDVKASSRQDGNSRAALTLAPLKAQTALAFRQPTEGLGGGDPVRVQSFLAAGFTVLGGGLPITDAETKAVIGAIGVGGGSAEQDVLVAQAGLRAAGADTPTATPSAPAPSPS